MVVVSLSGRTVSCLARYPVDILKNVSRAQAMQEALAGDSDGRPTGSYEY
jgi:hypothetical protein